MEAGGPLKCKVLDGPPRDPHLDGAEEALALCRGALCWPCHPEEKDHNSNVSGKTSVLMGWKIS